jgi:hypothetical protein
MIIHVSIIELKHSEFNKEVTIFQTRLKQKGPDSLHFHVEFPASLEVLKFEYWIRVFMFGLSEPAPTSAPSTGCPLLLSCG